MARRVVAALGADRDGNCRDSWLGPGARTLCRQPPDAVSVRVEFHPLAVDEIAGAVDWYERQRSGLGERFLDVVEATVNRAGRWRTRPSASRSSFSPSFTNGDFPTTGWNVPSSGVARGSNPSKISSKKLTGTFWIWPVLGGHGSRVRPAQRHYSVLDGPTPEPAPKGPAPPSKARANGRSCAAHDSLSSAPATRCVSLLDASNTSTKRSKWMTSP